MGRLRVLVTNDDHEWFAQGIDIDFAAAGKSLDDVQGRFERGLKNTIHAHLDRYGIIDGLLKCAPESEWREIKGRNYNFDIVTLHDASDLQNQIPFSQIAYIQQRPSAQR